MYCKSDNIEIMIGFDTDQFIRELLNSLLHRDQVLEQRMEGSKSEFDFVDELNYKCHKIILNRGGSYIDSLKWLKDKRVTINPKKKKKKK